MGCGMIVGTAGHIDHGKSALVTALSGRQVDRLVEEKRRGITIDLNFAPLSFAGAPTTGIVDVPGHEDFVRTMVAGASGIDLVLLVVDAAQGPQPQTWEHLAIVEQLRVPRGIPVITKADLAEPEWTELVVDELTARLAHSPVRFERPAVVSALTGSGIPELRERLRAIALEPRGDAPEDSFRMPVDRAFSIAGVGTVVTGTPRSGTLRVGDAVRLLPSGLEGRVRSLEAYGAAVAQARPGERTAVGIAGIERAAVRRGEVLLDQQAEWRATAAFDAQVELLPSAASLRRQLRVRVNLGTTEVLARVYPRPERGPHGTLLVRLALEQPLVARGRDRFVLRSYSPVVTIGGGRVLDPLPPRRAPWPDSLASESAADRLEALVQRRKGGVSAAELPLLLGEPAALSSKLVSLGGRYVGAELAASVRQAAGKLVEEYHRKHPIESGLSLETLRRSLQGPAEVIDGVVALMVEQGELRLDQGTVSLAGFRPELGEGAELLERALAVLEAAGLTPPSVPELEQQLGRRGLLPLLKHAAQQRRLVAVESERYYAPEALERFVHSVRQVATGQEITPSSLRDHTGLSRKYLIPLLEWADKSGVTRRVGDVRVLVQV